MVVARSRSPLLLLLAAVLVALAAVVALPSTDAEAAPTVASSFYNPVSDVYDPTIVTDGGFYYLIGTSGTRSLTVRKSSTVAGLRTTAPTTVWTGPASGLGCCRLESPHLQKVQGKWYIYLSVSDSNTSDRRAVYALEGNATDPLGPYTLKGTLKDRPGFIQQGVIGPAVIEMPNGQLYFTSTTFGFFIQAMSNPWTLQPGSSMVTIAGAGPVYAWEGATLETSYAFLKTVNGQTKVFMPYSSENGVDHRTNGGPCWSWCIGMFTNTDGNLLNPGSWSRSPQPVFAGGPDTGIYRVLALGTFKSPDGTEDWLTYNANDTPGTDWGERDTFVQKFSFNADGTPNFGRPTALNRALAVPSGETGSPPAIAPGATLLNDNFDSGVSGWAPSSGTWAACDGGYCSTGSGDSLSLVGDGGWTDYTVQASVITDNAPNNSGVNVIARASANDRLYNLELHKDGAGVRTWAIAGNYSGTWRVLAGGAYNWSPGVKYWLRLDANQGRLTGLISTDGVGFTQLGSASVIGGAVGDGDYGKPGLRTWGGLTARFDDVTVTEDRKTNGFYTGVGWPGLTIDAGGSQEANKYFCVQTYNEYCLGGNYLGTTNAIDTSGVPNPLPAAMYQTERWGDTLAPKYPGDDGSFRYVIPSLTPGTSYQLRLHFAELHYTAAGFRSFDVRINGATALDEFDTFAAAGGANRAVVREFTAVADQYGHILLEFLPGQAAGKDHNPTVSAIQVAPAVAVSSFSRTDQQVVDGTYSRIYDPDVSGVDWYINDHTIIRDDAGTWHMFGITDTEPVHSGGEQTFAHATASSLTGPWTRQPPALTASPAYGESFLWAPHVIKNGSTYYLFYAAGGPDDTNSAINLATSTDLTTWTRRPAGPVFRDGKLARDPQVVRVGSRWVMYYTATETATGGRNVVAYRTSTDLQNWSSRRIAFTDPSPGYTTESPFVIQHGDWWYLFTGPRGKVNAANNPGATVYRSKDPLHFNRTDRVGHLKAHAPEVVQNTDGAWYVSHAGWGEQGLWLSPLTWDQPVQVNGYTAASPSYRATVVRTPATRLAEVSVPTAEGGWRDLLEPDGRGSQPYLGVGAWGDTDPAGAAAGGVASGLAVTLTGIPLGNEPVTVDWGFTFSQRWFDATLTWHVNGPTSAPVRELSWSLDTAATPATHDNAGTNRNGDVAGFPQWTMSTGAGATAAVAYRSGSAWAAANRWYGHWYSSEAIVAFQSVQSAAGVSLANGTYNGGRWRVGVTPTDNDTTFAQQLHTGVNS